MTKQERAMVANLDDTLKEQAVIVCKIEKAMRSKVGKLALTFFRMARSIFQTMAA